MAWSRYDGRTIKLTQGKTKVMLVISVHPVLKAELDGWRATATSTMILTSVIGKPWNPESLTTVMRRTVDELGVPDGLNIHGLRKLAASMLAEAGCSTHEIVAITGHRNLGDDRPLHPQRRSIAPRTGRYSEVANPEWKPDENRLIATEM